MFAKSTLSIIQSKLTPQVIRTEGLTVNLTLKRMNRQCLVLVNLGEFCCVILSQTVCMYTAFLKMTE